MSALKPVGRFGHAQDTVASSENRPIEAKLFAAAVVAVALACSLPLLLHWWKLPADVSVHGHAVDAQMRDTMWGAGVCFVLAQILLAWMVWSFAGAARRSSKSFPGGASAMVIAAVALVGGEVLAFASLGQRTWSAIYFESPASDALPVQVQAGQFAFYFRYPGPDGKFGPLHPEKIDEGEQNFLGLDPARDLDSRDDVVTAEMAIPVNREIHLLMHTKDVGHSFYVRELRLQQDFVPGLDLSLHFTATQPGRYEIVCSQLCGLGHYKMKAYLTVMSQPDFERWLATKAGR